MDARTANDARENLRKREGISTNDAAKYVGSWPNGPKHPIPALEDWARARHLDAVVWTALPPKLESAKGDQPKEDEIINYIRELRGPRRTNAEQYVRRTPRQIDTAFRRRMEAEFNWTPLDGKT